MMEGAKFRKVKVIDWNLLYYMDNVDHLLLKALYYWSRMVGGTMAGIRFV